MRIWVLWLWFGWCAAGSADDLWIIPPNPPAPGAELTPGTIATARVHLGARFPHSSALLEPERIVRFDAIDEDRVTVLTSFRVEQKALLADLVVAPGDSILALSIGPRTLRFGAEEFNRHLLDDGVLQVYEWRRRLGRLDRPASERRSRHAKALVSAAGARGQLLVRAIGAPLEIVPLVDPTRLGAGQLLELRVLSRGRPAPGLTILAGGQSPQASRFSAVTDDLGEAAFPPDRPGLWYAHVIDMRRLEADPEADYECEWATLTFTIR
ncbi:MAG TPA: DUF4198 domain-containing protein [Acidobacteriota bacterium]